ncbi:hypothetical protein AYI68_g8021 [Smittium mucronatum]|uniref:Sensor domain-containing protein n=1 Tax=Smittium mucronatum TaxID=133383 RepID=A0A1R0GM38_9FUNG|nr:hypothetical protein AYI68_g8021 [Smittium mucronatum]
MDQHATLERNILPSELHSSEDQLYNFPSQNPVEVQETVFRTVFPENQTNGSNYPPPYAPARFGETISSSPVKDEKRNTTISIDNKNIPPIYNDPNYLPFPNTKQICVRCSGKSSYLGSLTDSTNWLAVLFQTVNLVTSFTSFFIVTFLFFSSTILLIALPIGLIFFWICSTSSRFFTLVEIKSFSMIKSHTDNCINCRSIASNKVIIPDSVIKSDARKGFLSTMYAPLKDSYTWLSFLFIILVNPIVSLTGVLLTYIGLTVGLAIFPLLPFVLKFIKIYSVCQRDLSFWLLNIKKD